MANAFIKNRRLIFLGLGIILAVWVLYLLRSFVFPFAVGLVLAYLLMPAVFWLGKRLPPRSKWTAFKRVISILIVFIILIAIVGGFAYFIVTALIDASTTLLQNAPNYIITSLKQIQLWLENIRAQLPPSLQQEVDKTIIDIGSSMGNIIKSALMGALSSIQDTFKWIIGLAVLPLFLFYIMKDQERLKRGYVSAVTPRIAEHTRNLVNIIERVLGRYIRAQIMLGIVVGILSFIGLEILQIPHAIALAVLAGITELIPTLGPWIGGAVAVIVTLAVLPGKVVWVIVLFVVVQLLENNLLVARVHSAYLHIHPAVMIVLLVFGAFTAGFWGLLLVGPLVATLVEIFKYLRDQQSKKVIAVSEQDLSF